MPKRARSLSISSSEDPDSPTPREGTPDVKVIHLDADSAISSQPAIMKCLLPPHEPMNFTSFEQYDIHYQQTHVNRCQECHKNFPDAHLLGLHISEFHDPLVAAKRDQGEKTYACLVEGCDRMCSTWQKRKMHCIDKHAFPKEYDFLITKTGIDKRVSMLRKGRRRSSVATSATATSATPRSRGGSVDSVEDAMDVVNEQKQNNNHSEQPVLSKTPTSPRAPVVLQGRNAGFKRGSVAKMRGGGGSFPGRGQPEKQSVAAEDPVASLTTSMSALKMIPRSVKLAQERKVAEKKAGSSQQSLPLR